MKRIITYGTFDLFHVGHVRLLKRLSGLGDELIVGVSTDGFNQMKGKNCVMSFDERSEIVASCRYVDEVFPEASWDQKVEDVKKYKANIFAIGDDWSGKFDFLESVCEVYYLPRTEDISTTELKKYINKVEIDKFLAARNHLEEAIRVLS